MKNKLFIFLILTSFNIQAQVSNRLLPVQNVHLSVSPNNFVYTVPPTDNRFYVASMDALRLKTFNVSGLNDTVKSIGDLRYKPTAYVPTWTEITSKPDLRTKAENDTYYKPISYVPTKTDVGLSNVDNTSDLNKPISTATQTALNGKLSAEIDGSTTNEIQSLSLVGSTLSLSLSNSVVLPLNTVTITAPTRTLNTNFTISTTKNADVFYTVTCSATNPLLVGSSSAMAFLEYSTNAGSTWNIVSQNGNTNSVALAVSVQLTNAQTGVLSGSVPANALVRIRSAISGTASVVLNASQEKTY